MTAATSGAPRIQEALWKCSFAVLLLLVSLNALGGVVADPDLWGYMAFGRLFWETGRFPYEDSFAYVPTLKPWVYHEWLTGVLFFPLYRAWGAPGLQLLKFLLGVGTVWLVYRTARLRGADFGSALLGLWGVQVFLALGYSPVRAQIFTYLFFTLSLYLLERARLQGKWGGVWLLAALQIPWCNLHGGFVAGLGLLALYGAGEALARRPFWPYLAACGAGALATLVNPYGLTYWTYITRAVTMPRPEISEWASLLTAWQAGLPKEPLIYYLALGVFAVALAAWARWREVTPMLVVGLTLYLGFRHLRHQVFFFLAAGSYLPLLLSALFRKILGARGAITLRPRLVAWLPTALACILALTYGYKFLAKQPLSLELPTTPDGQNQAAVHYPVGAVEYLRKNQLSGKMLNEFNWGEYLIWELYPHFRVAMDGRYETVYDDDLCRLHSDFFYARPGWERFLHTYPPDLILVDPRSKVLPLLRDQPQWTEAYADEGAVLFVRRVQTANR
jgi:hypothetical protein